MDQRRSSRAPVGDHADRPLGQEPIRQFLELDPSAPARPAPRATRTSGGRRWTRSVGPVRPASRLVEHRLVTADTVVLSRSGVRSVTSRKSLPDHARRPPRPASGRTGVRGLVLSWACGWPDGPTDQPRSAPTVRVQPFQLELVDLVGALEKPAPRSSGHALELSVAMGVRRRPLHPECPDQLALVGGPVDGVRRQAVVVQVATVQSRPASVRSLDAVGDDQMGVQQRVALA